MLLAVSMGLGHGAQAADGYAGIQGGVHFWPAYSNRDQVEADTDAGYSWAGVLGVDLLARDLPPDSSLWPFLWERLGLRLEIEGGQRYSDLHGVNDDFGQRTADGKSLEATTALFNVWPTVRVTEGWTAYVGGGVGTAWIRTLGSDKLRLGLQAGTGLLIDLPFEAIPMRLDIGWRSFFASSAEYRDRLVDFNTHGAVLGIHVKF